MSDTVAPLEYFFLVFRLLVAHKLQGQWLRAYILEAKKFAKPPFQSKKIAEKLRKSGRHCWAIWGNFEPFWFTFWPFWVILGHIWATLGHFWAIL